MFNNLENMLTNNFEKILLEEAINNLNSNSKIRFSNFAFVIRELIDIVLTRLAKDEDITNCSWYELPQNIERNVIRAQRIRYIIQGGFEENIFDLMLNIDFTNKISEINKYFRDELSNNVHLTERCINYSHDEIEEKTKIFEEIIEKFVSMINNVRQQILNFLSDEIELVVNESFLSVTLSDLDILSTHTRIDCVDNIEIDINLITPEKIIGFITGNVNVFLQYGSDRDVREGLGDISNDSYPFELPFTIDIEPLNDLFNELNQEEKENFDYITEVFMPEFRNTMFENLDININQVRINTDSFYE